MEPSSPNFSTNELRCYCEYCRGTVPNEVRPEALAALQRIRTRLGKGIGLTGAYRCARHSREVNKTTIGRHRQGLAFDIGVGWGNKRMLILKYALEEGFKGFGFADNFIHLDYRPEELASWGYN